MPRSGLVLPPEVSVVIYGPLRKLTLDFAILPNTALLTFILAKSVS